MRKVLKKSIILYKSLFQVIIAGPVGVTTILHKTALSALKSLLKALFYLNALANL